MTGTSAQKRKLRILAIGAHPDDCEIESGGTAALWSGAGHTVHFVSATNGATGHQVEAGAALVRRRAAEAIAAARVLGVTSQILDIPNGELEPSLVYRRVFIKLIREFAPDLVLTHRPCDYHPDHRYTAQLVQDASYLIGVPNNVPTVPPLRKIPVIAYFSDRFRNPVPFRPDVVVVTDRVFDRKVRALDCHRSQFYEWLPWNEGLERTVPRDARGRLRWLAEKNRKRFSAEAYRSQLREVFGAKAAQAAKTVEAFEICEYGAKATMEELRKLFPFR
ncbi:MAG: PIG-L family deacetylase [Planctomycetota bacterium]